ncbi:hypothetical protein U0C82_07655 [Fulvimarina sp. 2208YS6-2-32]|uniref:Plug domain-containing protein n=1 Tax=Fulvimarina uroteuthidis TaxID=3098149 RepID=A0ABU5I1K4_9HYPH|nr:hypothetical protein [Fulvimarina sp. 2208YS6-2-32]MDY8109017.1 hypothetical protein [Fulvimarina sp. 2208YS6-2-32]
MSFHPSSNRAMLAPMIAPLDVSASQMSAFLTADRGRFARSRRTSIVPGRLLPIAVAAMLGLCAMPAGTLAQPLGPGPAGTLPGTSMADLPIVGAPRTRPGIPGAEIFGDTNAERRYGKPFDDSYLRPKVIRPDAGNSAARQAILGRPDLNGVSAEIFAREGPSAIGGSAISRGQSRGRDLRRTAPPQRPHPATGGRAIIRR